MQNEERSSAFAITECQDRLAVQGTVVRRHFWRRLLPSVGITTYGTVSVLTGLGAPALIMTGVFGLFTLREGFRFRENLVRLRRLEAEFVSLSTSGEAPVSPP